MSAELDVRNQGLNALSGERAIELEVEDDGCYEGEGAPLPETGSVAR
jgi:hypothetical protein